MPLFSRKPATPPSAPTRTTTACTGGCTSYKWVPNTSRRGHDFGWWACETCGTRK